LAAMVKGLLHSAVAKEKETKGRWREVRGQVGV
jgi:hypothetical protein